MDEPQPVVVSLFAGMGGFDLAARMVGWESAVICEIDPLCQVVLKHHFPESYLHGDIHTLTGSKINEEIEKRFGPRDSVRVVLVGGFPCQPYSTAGKRLGKADTRHLWPEMLRLIHECRPDAIVGENVSGILSWNGGLVFDEVQTQMENEGYEVQSVVLPACGINAPHRRDRVWFVAARKDGHNTRSPRVGEEKTDAPNSIDKRQQGKRKLAIRGLEGIVERRGLQQVASDTERIGQQGSWRPEGQGCTKAYRDWKASWSDPDGGWPTEQPLCDGDDGLSARLGGIRVPSTGKKLTATGLNQAALKMGGNAVVPQLVARVFRALESTWNLNNRP